MKKTGVIYARRSSDNRNQLANSIPGQIAEVKKLAKEFDIELPFEVYAEQGKGDEQRDRWDELVSDCENGVIDPDYLLVWNTDRIARVFDHEWRQRTIPLQRLGIRYIAESGEDSRKVMHFNVRDDDIGGSITQQLRNHKHRMMLIDLGEVISKRSETKAQAGNLYSRDLFGWRTDREYDNNGTLTKWSRVPDPVDSKIVKRMFECFVKTENLTAAAAILRESEKYPKKYCLRCKEDGRRGSYSPDVESCPKRIMDDQGVESPCGCTEFGLVEVTGPVVRTILRNQWHCGDYAYYKTNTGRHWTREADGTPVKILDVEYEGGKVDRRQNGNPLSAYVYLENHHEGIIDRDTFVKTQEILERNKSGHTNRKRKGYYTGKVFCQCGSPMTYGATQGKPKYKCDKSCGRKNLVDPCTGGNKAIREEDLELIFTEIVEQKLSDPRVWFDNLQRVVELVGEKETNNTQELFELKRKIVQLDELLKPLDMTNPIDVHKFEKMCKQKIEIEKMLEDLREQSQSLNDEPLLKVLDEVGEEYGSLIDQCFPSENWTLAHYSMNDRAFKPVKRIQNLADYDSSLGPVLAWSEDRKQVLNFIEDVDSIVDLIGGDIQKRLALGYLVASRCESENALMFASILLAESFGLTDHSVESFDPLTVIESVELRFMPSADAADHPVAQRFLRRGYRNTVCGYSASVAISGQKQRSRNFRLHINCSSE